MLNTFFAFPQAASAVRSLQYRVCFCAQHCMLHTASSSWQCAFGTRAVLMDSAGRNRRVHDRLRGRCGFDLRQEGGSCRIDTVRSSSAREGRQAGDGGSIG